MQLGPIYYVTRYLFNWLMLLLGGRLRVSGQHNVPTQGPYLLVANHMSMADSPAMLLAIPPQQSYFWIADKWRTLPVFGWLAAKLGGIFINRDGIDRRAVKRALQLLRQGEVVGLAPEATRSPIGQIIRPRNGAAYLASRADVPIVPVGIVGTDRLFHNFFRGRRTPIEVRFGPVLCLPPVEGRVRQQQLRAYTDYIMLHVIRLLPPQQYGYYSWIAHPGVELILAGKDPWPACVAHAQAAEAERSEAGSRMRRASPRASPR